ncbi:hypothetical protein [Micromonospora sp. NPDC004704]
MTRSTEQRYAFDDASDQANDHHDALGRLPNAQTRQFIGDLIDLPGTSCLEVGAGATASRSGRPAWAPRCWPPTSR